MIKQRISVNWYWSTMIGQSHYLPERMRAIRGPRDIAAQAPIRRLRFELPDTSPMDDTMTVNPNATSGLSPKSLPG